MNKIILKFMLFSPWIYRRKILFLYREREYIWLSDHNILYTPLIHILNSQLVRPDTTGRQSSLNPAPPPQIQKSQLTYFLRHSGFQQLEDAPPPRSRRRGVNSTRHVKLSAPHLACRSTAPGRL
jgi:hypothetical protein